jgi:hypothetical protein
MPQLGPLGAACVLFIAIFDPLIMHVTETVGSASCTWRPALRLGAASLPGTRAVGMPSSRSIKVEADPPAEFVTLAAAPLKGLSLA